MKSLPLVLAVALIAVPRSRAADPVPLQAVASARSVEEPQGTDRQTDDAAGWIQTYPYLIPIAICDPYSNHFNRGDGARITMVRGTAPTFMAGGHYLIEGVYKLKSMPWAKLVAVVTEPSGYASPWVPAQQSKIFAGNGHFQLQFPVSVMGHLHLSLYPPGGGKSHGQLNFQDARFHSSSGGGTIFYVPHKPEPESPFGFHPPEPDWGTP